MGDDLRPLAALVAIALIASAVRAEPGPVSAKTTVSRLLDAIRRGDQAGYAEVGPKLVIMAIPDFGAPVSWEDAQRTFGPCSLQSLSEPRPLDGVPAYIVTATMTCSAPFPQGALTFDFMADREQVHGVYPGGIDRFYPDLRKRRDAQR